MPVIIDVGLSGIFNTLRELKALKNKLIFREHYLSVNDVFKSLSHHSFEKDFAKKITTKNINEFVSISFVIADEKFEETVKNVLKPHFISKD